MKPRDVVFRVRIADSSAGDMPAFLDMLRYEAGQVEDWSRTEGAYLVRIRVMAARYTPARWRSFGISPEELS